MYTSFTTSIVWLCYLALYTLASTTTTTLSSSQDLTVLTPQIHHIHSRDQAIDSSCSEEGQWNCMTTSFQRCASGRWSAVMQCARGTRCSPAGLTTEFYVQHDGSVSGNGGGVQTTSGATGGNTRTSSSGVVVVALLAWYTW